MSTTKYSFKEAFKESRDIVVAALLVAVAYNLFAATSVPWIRHLPSTGDTASYEELMGASVSVNRTGDSVPDPAAAAAIPLDTGVAGSKVDTTAQTDQARLLQEQKRREDSTKLAKAEALRKLDSAKKAQAAASPTTTPAPSDQEALPKEIGTATAKRLFDEKKARFIDARPATDFAKGHIPGAMNVYANEFRDHIPKLLPLVANNEIVVAYCGGGLCELSHELADQLRLIGFKRVVVYTGGTTEWTANNYPFTTGE